MPSRRYRITHETRYLYSDPVAICQNQVMMIPRQLPTVQCREVTVSITPPPHQIGTHIDYFGNPVQTFSIETQHRELTVLVSSDVVIDPPRLPAAETTLPWELVRESLDQYTDADWFSVYEFQLPSALVGVDAAFADYAQQSFTPGRPILQAGIDLTQRIHADFSYDSRTTHVGTTAAEAFQLRSGVCQDFAQVQLACLRSLRLPARYVSGYLRTLPPPGKPRLIGADESHAWISLYAGPGLGWVDLDPTNACLVDRDHVPICVGRDYRDVAPMRGVVLGGGSNILKVSVDVVPQDDPSQDNAPDDAVSPNDAP